MSDAPRVPRPEQVKWVGRWYAKAHALGHVMREAQQPPQEIALYDLALSIVASMLGRLTEQGIEQWAIWSKEGYTLMDEERARHERPCTRKSGDGDDTVRD